MTEPSEPDVDLTAHERALAERLQAERPVPGARFRGELSRELVGRDPGYGPRPLHLRGISACYLAGGIFLLLLGALQATGSL
jgi:hypothetical protein